MRPICRLLCSSSAIVLLGVLLLACNGETQGNSVQFFALDTPCSITLQDYVPDSLFFAAEQEVQRIEKLMSSYRPSSEISILNRDSENVLSPDTFALLQQALDFAQQSQGLFDPTIGALSQLWDITGSRALLRYEEQLKDSSKLKEDSSLSSDVSGNQQVFQVDGAIAQQLRSQRKPPAQEEIDRALSLVSYRDVQLEAASRRVRLAQPGMKLDLGGIAKGFAADQIARILQQADAPPGVIDLGGNILLHGRKASGDPWSVGVRGEGDSYLLGMFIFQPRAIVTSGIYQRYYTYEGKRYHHILSTQTGYPVDNGMFSVTVIANSSTEADALATMLFIYGMERGLAEVQRRQDEGKDIQALFISEDFQVFASSGFAVLSEGQYSDLKEGKMQRRELSLTNIWLFSLQENLKFANIK